MEKNSNGRPVSLEKTRPELARSSSVRSSGSTAPGGAGRLLFRFEIDARLSEVGEQMVCLAFLIEGLL